MGTKEVTVTGTGPSVNLGADVSICGGTTTITAAPTGGATPYTYLWSNNATTPAITVGAGTYSVTVTDANQCTASDAVVVTVGNNLSAPYVGMGTFCGCGQVVAKARRQPAVAGKMFVWYDNPNRTGTPLASTMSPEGDVSLLSSTTSRTVWAFEKRWRLLFCWFASCFDSFPCSNHDPLSTTGKCGSLWQCEYYGNSFYARNAFGMVDYTQPNAWY